MWGSKLLRLRHGDSSTSNVVTGATGGTQGEGVTLPGASPAGTGVPASGRGWAAAAGS